MREAWCWWSDELSLLAAAFQELLTCHPNLTEQGSCSSFQLLLIKPPTTGTSHTINTKKWCLWHSLQRDYCCQRVRGASGNWYSSWPNAGGGQGATHLKFFLFHAYLWILLSCCKCCSQGFLLLTFCTLWYGGCNGNWSLDYIDWRILW